MEKWHYIVEDRQEGPVDEFRLALLWRQGRLTPETLVWRAGLPEWLPLSEAMPQWIRKEEAAPTPVLSDQPRHTSFTRTPGKRALEAKKAFTRRPQGEAAEAAPKPVTEAIAKPVAKKPVEQVISPPVESPDAPVGAAGGGRSRRVLAGVVVVAGLALAIWTQLPRNEKKPVAAAQPVVQATPTPSPEPVQIDLDETAIKTSGVAREMLPARVLDFALDPASVRLNEVNGLKILKASYGTGGVTIGLQFLKVNSQAEGEETAFIAAKSAGVADPVATGENPKIYQVIGRNEVHFSAWTAAGVVFTAVSPDAATEQRFLRQYLSDTLETLPAGAGAY